MGFRFEASGKVQKPTAAELAKADETNCVLCLSKGNLADGKPYYAFIAVKPSKFAEFHRLSSERKPIDLDDYGEVLSFDTEVEPPQGIMDIMQSLYGFDPNFEKRLVEELAKERKEFGDKQEDKRVMDIVAMLKAQKPAGNA